MDAICTVMDGNRMILHSYAALYFSALTIWLGNRKGVWPVKRECGYIGDGDMTGALHVVAFWLLPALASASPLIATKSRMVLHFGIVLPILFWKLAVKTSVCMCA